MISDSQRFWSRWRNRISFAPTNRHLEAKGSGDRTGIGSMSPRAGGIFGRILQFQREKRSIRVICATKWRTTS